jgi:hypothetical protein
MIEPKICIEILQAIYVKNLGSRLKPYVGFDTKFGLFNNLIRITFFPFNLDSFLTLTRVLLFLRLPGQIPSSSLFTTGSTFSYFEYF